MFSEDVIHNSYTLHELLISKGRNLCLFKNDTQTKAVNLNMCTLKPNFNPMKITSVHYCSFYDNTEALRMNIQLYHEIKVLLAVMAIRQCVKSFLSQSSIRSIFENYYGVVSNYSHRKLKILLRLGCFRLILEKFVNTGPLEIMINGDITLNKNADKYRQSARELLNLKIKI